MCDNVRVPLPLPRPFRSATDAHNRIRLLELEIVQYQEQLSAYARAHSGILSELRHLEAFVQQAIARRAFTLPDPLHPQTVVRPPGRVGASVAAKRQVSELSSAAPSSTSGGLVPAPSVRTEDLYAGLVGSGNSPVDDISEG